MAKISDLHIYTSKPLELLVAINKIYRGKNHEETIKAF
jgi:hypothetical protein